MWSTLLNHGVTQSGWLPESYPVPTLWKELFFFWAEGKPRKIAEQSPGPLRMEAIPRHPQTWFDETNWVFFANERDSPIREEKHPGDHCPRQYRTLFTPNNFSKALLRCAAIPLFRPSWWYPMKLVVHQFIAKAFPSGSGSELWHPNFFTRKTTGIYGCFSRVLIHAHIIPMKKVVNPRNHPHWLTINGCESSHPRMVVVCGIV